MKTLDINPDSLSFRFLKTFNGRAADRFKYRWSQANTCDFIRSMILASIKFLILALVLIAITVPPLVVAPYAFFVDGLNLFMIGHELKIPAEFAGTFYGYLLFYSGIALVMTLGLLCIAAIGCIAVGIVALVSHYGGGFLRKRRDRKWEEKNSDDYKEPEPAALTVAYRAWKEKVCVPIRVLEKEDAQEAA